jgi:hypothetical protein
MRGDIPRSWNLLVDGIVRFQAGNVAGTEFSRIRLHLLRSWNRKISDHVARYFARITACRASA